MCRISKIITFLESLRQAGWFDIFESDIQALLIFDPLITLWGNFDAPYLKLLNDTRVASACFYVRTCRRVRNSKKTATIRNFHLPGSFLCLSTRLLLLKLNRLFYLLPTVHMAWHCLTLKNLKMFTQDDVCKIFMLWNILLFTWQKTDMLQNNIFMLFSAFFP